MSNKDEKNHNQGWEADINKAVDNIMSAVDIDLKEIKKNVQETMTDISMVMKESTRQYKEAERQAPKKETRIRPERNRDAIPRPPRRVQDRPARSPQIVRAEIVPVNRHLPGNTAKVLLSVFGSLGTAGFAPACIAMAAVFLSGDIFVLGPLFMCLCFLAGSLAMLRSGVKLRQRHRRFQTYLRCIQGRPFCKIKELASSVQKSEAFVVKDLRKMIENQMFLEAHLDDEEIYLISNHETYRQYLSSKDVMQQRIAQQKQEETKGIEQKTQSAEVSQKEMTEVDKAVFQGKEYIRQMRMANDLIPGEEISNKLDRLEKITTKIFIFLEKNPHKLPETRKFMEYYLPTTLKLIDSYQEFEENGFEGETVTKAKREIEQTLDTINSAFENLFDSMFEDAAMDLSTDISVLETMLAQEGLTKNFK